MTQTTTYKELVKKLAQIWNQTKDVKLTKDLLIFVSFNTEISEKFVNILINSDWDFFFNKEKNKLANYIGIERGNMEKQTRLNILLFIANDFID